MVLYLGEDNTWINNEIVIILSIEKQNICKYKKDNKKVTAFMTKYLKSK